MFISFWVLTTFFRIGVVEARPEEKETGPDWATIKAKTSVIVAVTDEFGQPYRQPVSTLAWEDGVFISRDGLRLYAFYAPADMIQYSVYAQQNPICPDITPFLRGPTLGMDLTTNPWGCENILHSDIAVATRSAFSEPFAAWKISKIATPYRYDGGFQELDNRDGTYDIVFNRSTENRLDDIFWARNVGKSPPLEDFETMPSPINTGAMEGNPHLERLADQVLVLLFDNHGAGDPTTRIRYSLSSNDGDNWSEPAELGDTINASTHTLHGHLYHDGKNWWLYFASDRDGRLSIFRSRHRQSINITGRFDDWETAELVIAPGTVEGGLGYIAGVGEPTLTRYGDLSFAVVYGAVVGDSDTDRFDIDPWFLPRKRPQGRYSLIRLWGHRKE